MMVLKYHVQKLMHVAISLNFVSVTSRSEVLHKGHVSDMCVLNCVGL